jgi:hypothetical protein
MFYKLFLCYFYYLDESKLQFHKMKGLFFTLTVIILLFGCKSAEQVKADTPPKGKRYAIGQGGGFTGDYSEFILSENGKVHKYDFNYDREVYFKDLEKADLIYFLEKIETLSLEGIEMNEPGNRTFYIDVRIGKTSINRVVWGHPNFNPDQELVDFHQEIYKKISTWD